MSTKHTVEIWLGSGPTQRRVRVAGQYTFALSFLEAGQAWTITLWRSDRTTDNGWDALTDPDTGVKVGQRMSATVDGDVILSGYIEVHEIGDAAEGHGGVNMVVSGRDLAGAAISFDADPTVALKGRPLDEALQDLFRGVGLTVQVSEHADPEATVPGLRTPRRGRSRPTRRAHPVDDAHPKIGERVWSIAERLVRRLGFRLWVAPGSDDRMCALVVDTPRNGGTPLWQFARGDEGFLTGREVTSIRDVPTAATVFAQAPRGEAVAAGLRREVTNGALLTDEILERVELDLPVQPRYVESRTARTDDAARQEAGRVLAEANEKLRVYRTKRQGHGQGGRIFAPNTLATVDDPVCRVRGRRLVTTVTFHGARDGGQTTELELVPEGTISTEPSPS